MVPSSRVGHDYLRVGVVGGGGVVGDWVVGSHTRMVEGPRFAQEW